ncbi:ATP-binding cassette domain-containing protein [Pseudonocardia sp. HH130630-07]|uniref:ATP-binding cassette domain-containing protein n=1 Tax=Pseudonocardia sp. HH130630-07 TaxID=1690815 RepID=UPI0008152D3F|nr:ABC transporter ATP-binding protein [Pseudonocardia sp. HH130630-07]ANY06439.1 hypothetical protein AFB00_09200 [Pseudonocardia sp. HH130630-07]
MTCPEAPEPDSGAPTGAALPEGIVADGVSVRGAHGPLLEPTSLHAPRGRVVVVAGPPGSGHTALALCLAGRMRPSTGRVTLDGGDTADRLRRAVAVVDTPGVSEPEPVLPLRTVVGEELAMAGRGTLPRSVVAWLDERGAGQWARTRFEDVPAPVRITLMTGLAASRPGTEVLVLTAPDRHGGTPAAWWQVACEQAGAGLAVVVTCAESTAALLGVPVVRLGGHGPDPVVESAGRHTRPIPRIPAGTTDDPEQTR